MFFCPANRVWGQLEAFQKSVRGNIECVGLKDGAVLICDDEGKLKGLRPNRRLGGDLIVGTFLIAGVDAEGDFCSLTETQAERWKKELAEPLKNIESLVQLRDLLQIGLPDNTYLVHRDADIGVCPADGLRLDALPEKFQTAWNDVLAAQVCWIRQCCFSKRMRKVFRKNEKSMLQNCNKKAKRKGRLQRVKKPM